MDIVENCLVGLAMLDEIVLTPNLEYWDNRKMRIDGPNACGSAACFGGWVAVHPHFQRLGVDRYQDGTPQMGCLSSHEIATRLFGDENMFKPHHCIEKGTETLEVRRRLYYALSRALG